MDDAIEAVARAIFKTEWPRDDWDHFKDGDILKGRYADMARAAIAAMPVEEAVRHEREACAKLAYDLYCQEPEPGSGRDIGDAIRSRTTP